jgi:predicted transposase YdaD
LAEAREKALRDERMRVRDAKREGREEGRNEGIYLGQAQMIQNMINVGKSVKEISDFTGMVESEINKIIQ